MSTTRTAPTTTRPTAPTADLAEIRRGLGVLFKPGDVVELRILEAGRAGTISGYYNKFYEVGGGRCEAQ